MTSKEYRIGQRSWPRERDGHPLVALGPGGEFEENWMIQRGFLECTKVLSLMRTEEK